MFHLNAFLSDWRRTSTRAPWFSYRPHLEQLEDREVPSLADGTLLVTTGPSLFSFVDQSAYPIGIIGVNPSSGEQFPVSTGGLFRVPTYVCEAPNGQLYVTDLAALDPSTGDPTGAVIQVDPNTGTQTVLAAGGFIAGPNVLAFINGFLYVADAGSSSGSIHNLVQIDPRTGQQRLVSSGGGQLETHPVQQRFGGPEATPGDPSRVQRYPITIQRGFSVPVGMVPAPGNNVYVADEPGNVQGGDPGKIWLVNLDTGEQTVLSSNNTTQGMLFNHPSDLAVDPSGNLIVANTGSAANGYAASLFRVNPQTGVQTLVASFTGATGLDSVALDASYGTIFVGAISFGMTPARIYTLDPQTGTPDILSSGNLLSLVEGMTVYREFGPMPAGDVSLLAGSSSPNASFSFTDTISPPQGSTPRWIPLELRAVAAVLVLESQSQPEEPLATDPMLPPLREPAGSDLAAMMSPALGSWTS